MSERLTKELEKVNEWLAEYTPDSIPYQTISSIKALMESGMTYKQAATIIEETVKMIKLIINA